MMGRFTNQGGDLLHLHLTYDTTTYNFFVRTNRIAEGFNEPTDAVLAGNNMFVIEYGGKEGNIWKITLPSDVTSTQKNITTKMANGKSFIIMLFDMCIVLIIVF